MTTTPEYLAEAINILCERGEIITRIDIVVSSGEWGEPKEQYNIKHVHKSQLLNQPKTQVSLKRKLKVLPLYFLRRLKAKLIHSIVKTIKTLVPN